MPDAYNGDSPSLTVDELCRFLEAWRGRLSMESLLRAGFVGTKVILQLNPPNRKPIIHEALRPDERVSGRALPTFASELEQMVWHLKLAYPELEQITGH